MTKRQDLYLQRRSRPEQSDQRQANQAANISHQPRASPDSTSLTSRIKFPTTTAALKQLWDHRNNVHIKFLEDSERDLYKPEHVNAPYAALLKLMASLQQWEAAGRP
jgi:hypothetical protein